MYNLKRMTFEEIVTGAILGLFLVAMVLFGVMFFQQVDNCIASGGVQTSDGYCIKKESVLSP